MKPYGMPGKVIEDARSEFIKSYRKTLEFLGCTGIKFEDMDLGHPYEFKYQAILPGKITQVTINGKIGE